MSFLYRFRIVFFLATLAACAALTPGVRRALVVDNGLSVWFLENDPALRAYHDFQQRYGNDEVVVLVVRDARSVLAPAYLRRFVALSDSLEALPDVAGVLGPGNATVPRFGLLGAGTRPLLRAGTGERSIRQTLKLYPTLRRSLFSDDYRSARFVIRLRAMPDFDDRRGAILETIRRQVYRQFSPDQAHFGGVGIVYVGLNDLSQHDFGLFLGLGYLLMIVLLFVLYRDPLLVLYPLGVVALASYLTFGAYGALGYRVNLMTVLLPLILVILGLLDSMHVLNERNRLAAAGTTSARETALQALRAVFRPCLFTMLTTATGFLALLTSPMAILRTFGVFAALGIALCWVLTFGLGVLLLPLAKPRPRSTRATERAEAHLVSWHEFVLAHRRAFTLLTLVLALGLAAGLVRLQSDTYTLGYLPGTHPVVTDHRTIEARWGPYLPLDLLVEPRPGHRLTDPVLLRATFAFADSVGRVPGVGEVTGYHALLQAGLEFRYRTGAWRLRGDSTALRAIERQWRAEYPTLVRQYVHDPTGTGRLTVSGTMLSARQLTAKLDTVLLLANATLGPLATVRPAGYQPMYATIVGYVTESQTNSLLLSVVGVFALTALFLGSVRLAALAIGPNLFPVLVLLGAMGWLGIALDTATASIAAIVLSLCVDDTIHFIYQYHRLRQRGVPPAAARLTTIRHVGPTIVLTSGVLLLGYAVLLLGSLKTVQYFGLLTVISLVAAVYGELVLFPLVLRRFDRAAAVPTSEPPAPNRFG